MSGLDESWEEPPVGKKSARPKLSIERTKLEIMCEVLSALIVASMIFYAAALWESLPDKIPSHFNIAGQADAWGDKSGLFLLGAIACAMYAGLSALQRFPHIYNYPFGLNARNVRRQYLLARQLLTVIKLEIVGCFGFAAFQIIRVARGQADGFQPWFMLLFLPVLAGTVAVYFVKARKAV